jgi:uncharacterized protein YkwD
LIVVINRIPSRCFGELQKPTGAPKVRPDLRNGRAIMNIYCVEWFDQNKRVARVVGTICVLALIPICAQSQPLPTTAGARTPQAPPTPPPVVVSPATTNQARPPMPPAGNTPWSIGQPTDEEQLYLEYINRARANPPAEGGILATTTDPDVLSAYNSFSVDLNLMQSQFNAIAPAPPVAMHAELMAAARVHSQDMFQNIFQGHTGTDGSNPGNRITTQGYNWSSYGENVYAYAESVFYGHAGFEVDWGPGPGGMQTPPGHRISIHNAGFREVGVGVVLGLNGTVGPQLVTQDFGTRQGATPLITGVVYYDLNGNSFYDLGEGIGGVTVQVPGSVYFAVTANSGGYAVPVTTNGSYTMSFTATGLSADRMAAVSALANVKQDFVPVYTPPTVSGPNPAALTNNNYFSFNLVGAATNHQWEASVLGAYTSVEGAEDGLANVTVESSAGYAVQVASPVVSGSYAFHLAQPDGDTDQILTLNSILLLRADSQLSFAKRLGWATTTQFARAQISTDGGNSWAELWSQPGSNGSGEGSYSTVDVALDAYAGLPAQFRFVYAHDGGTFFPQTSSGVGLYLDDIAISNADQAQSSVLNNIPSGNTIAFHPTNTGNYLLRVRAQLPGRVLPWGPAAQVTVTDLPPMTIQFVGQPMRMGNQFQADFSVGNYRSGTSFTLLKATDLGSGWTPDTVATVQTIVSNTQFRVTTTNAASRGFFQIRAN